MLLEKNVPKWKQAGSFVRVVLCDGRRILRECPGAATVWARKNTSFLSVFERKMRLFCAEIELFL